MNYSKGIKHRFIKWLKIFIKKPASTTFYLIDRFYDSILLRVLGKIWWLEYKLRGGLLGKGVFLGRPILKFYPNSQIILEDGSCIISDNRRCASGNIYSPSRIHTLSATSVIHIGKGVGMNGTSIVSRTKSIHIGDYTMIAPNCRIIDSPFHKMWPPENRCSSYSSDGEDKDIVIGNNCWICTGCIILAGSVIGDNSVIGAGSLVKGVIPPNCFSSWHSSKSNSKVGHIIYLIKIVKYLRKYGRYKFAKL